MSRKRKGIAEIADDRHRAVSGPVRRRNGHDDGRGLLSWYLAEPRADRLTYVLTAQGYVIVPAGLRGSGRGLDTDEMMEQNYQ